MGHFGFSYIGLIFLLMLFIPNIIWSRNQPQGYSDKNENKVLVLFERVGEILVTICVLIFKDFNYNSPAPRTLCLFAAFIIMIMYELWWIRYFKSERTLSDFYSSFLGIPLAGAVLPVIAVFFLGIYGKVVWILIADVILGIGHIGIHVGHKKEIEQSET